MCHFQSQNSPFVLNNFCLVQTIIITLVYLLALFIVQNLQHILMANPKLWGCPIFGTKMVHLPQTNFLENYYHFYLTISPFHCTKFQKKSSSGSRVMSICNFWAYNGSFAQMRVLSENLLMNLVPFIRAYLHVKNQSQVLIY